MPTDYSVVEQIGVFSEYENRSEGTLVTKEVNIVAWGDYPPALDIRKWQDGEPKKGISINDQELDDFFAMLRKAYPDRF